ncbi:Serine/threonine-protein kinase pkn3 [Minicystis rosea]|nr:Serine/threonine-protein kinase pkn3 [Minicystis rosea]
MTDEADPPEDGAFDITLLSDLTPPRQGEPTKPSEARATVRRPEEVAAMAAADRNAGTTLHSAEATAAALAADVHIGQVLAGKYELVKLLGQGGMGKVFKGEHLSLGVPVAVKTMHPEIAASNDYVRRFRREAHAASVLNHPNAVRVLDFGEDNGILYMVMEFLQGASLSHWLGRQPQYPSLADIADIMSQLLDAFEVAHGYGIVHRDLKPDNIFLTEVGGKRVVKVVDFGLAHVDDTRDQGPTLTSKDVIAGTPEYMSPEQCRSLAVGPSADIYSIGCVLTVLLQLRPPFSGASAIEVLAKQMFTPPPALTRPPNAEPVPPLLERLRLDLLAKAPEKRPATAAEVKRRLLEAMSEEATEARLPTRKGDEPLGDRAARAPKWDEPEAAPQTARARQRIMGLLRLAVEPGGIDGECEAGLASHKLEIMAVRTAAEAASQGLTVLVIDAGHKLDEARALLLEMKKSAPGCRVVVCAAKLDTERMNELVGAGAADVARYPVTADALGKKVERVFRRGR